jgi:hypothetical protein
VWEGGIEGAAHSQVWEGGIEGAAHSQVWEGGIEGAAHSQVWEGGIEGLQGGIEGRAAHSQVQEDRGPCTLHSATLIQQQCDILLCSFSYTSCVLCGVGRDRHGKTQVVLWDTSRLRSTGEVSVIAKAHTEAIIEKMKVAMFECQR